MKEAPRSPLPLEAMKEKPSGVMFQKFDNLQNLTEGIFQPLRGMRLDILEDMPGEHRQYYAEQALQVAQQALDIVKGLGFDPEEMVKPKIEAVPYELMQQ